MQRLTPNGINSFKQNRPCLIAADLSELGIPHDTTYGILLARGVFKWLAVRRDLIRLKDDWKGHITVIIATIREAKRVGDHYHHAYLKGYLRGYEECRARVRELCHSERWRCPDNDKHAQDFLERMAGGSSNN